MRMAVFCDRRARRRGAVVAALLGMLGNLLGVLVAAAVGIHCSAATEPDDGASESSESAGSAPAAGGGNGARRPASDEPSGSTVPSTPPAVVGPDLTSLVHRGALPLVTSSVKDESGATYATGTFVGHVGIGDTVIRSRGDKDVFLLKLDAAGAFQWVRAIGSASVESAPRVSLDGKSVTVIGMTKGQMDCGSGPMATWSSDTFFLCMFGGADGLAQSGGVFPTGSP
jgi:hypothetical protein